MKKAILLILLIFVSCNQLTRYETESMSFLKAVYSDYDTTNCNFAIHTYGLIMPPIIDSKELEKELSEFLGPDVFSRIKVQKGLSMNFKTDIKFSENHISNSELTMFLKEIENSNLKFWDEINKRYGCISGISIPIFSDDYKYAFIYEY